VGWRATKQKTVTTSTTCTWLELESIKTIAKGKDIWSYVNPESLPVLECPSAPTVSDVRPGATTIEDLSANELDNLKERRKNHRIARNKGMRPGRSL
jgi:hypothetical protein